MAGASRAAEQAANPAIAFREDVAQRLIAYGRMVVARSYIHNSLGNIAIRVADAGYADGVVYTRHAGVSLEEMTPDHVVITDIPTGRLLRGTVTTSIGHQLNREILRLSIRRCLSRTFQHWAGHRPRQNGTMQRTLTGLVAFLMLIVGCGVVVAQTSETIRITNGEWQPFLSKDVPHHGFASHIVTEAFALVGVEVEYGFFPWSRAMKLARDGIWDGTAVWGTSEKRLQKFHFTDVVVPSTYVFFHLKTTAFDWDDYDDLGDLKVGGTVEYSYSNAFEAAEAAGVFRTIRGRSDEVSLKNLLKRRLDVFPGEPPVTSAVFPASSRSVIRHESLIYGSSPLRADRNSDILSRSIRHTPYDRRLRHSCG